MFTNAPEFRLWLQRNTAEDPPFRLRWQVLEGRGTLVLPRGGGKDAAPATSSGTLSHLSPSALHQARFVVVSDASGGRNLFSLGPFDLVRLDQLDNEAWIALDWNPEGTALELPPSPAGDPIAPPPPPAPITAQDRIHTLEEALARTERRAEGLSRRVADLERQIQALGGTVGPVEIDTRPPGG